MVDIHRSCRERWLIAGAVLLAASILLARNLCADRTYGGARYINTGRADGALVRVTPCLYGWPFHFLATSGFIARQGDKAEVWNGWLEGAEVHAFWLWPLLANLAVAALLAGLCGLAMDEWRVLARPQFSLAALLGVTAAVAILLAVAPRSYLFVEFLIHFATYVVLATAGIGLLPRLERVVARWRRPREGGSAEPPAP